MRTVLQKQERTRSIFTGGLIGFLVAGTLALPSLLPPAIANDEPFRTLLSSANDVLPKKIEAEDFLKPEYSVEPWVSTEAVARHSVRKIGYGRTEFVSIAETPTGTYSSDGLSSAHVRYPGIVRNSKVGPSFTVVPFKGGFVVTGKGGTCVAVRYGVYC